MKNYFHLVILKFNLHKYFIVPLWVEAETSQSQVKHSTTALQRLIYLL